ncbi:ribosome recycling factor [Candidatus Dependentiae bacterium]|nr:ribosome recycling factor [Candidatus Dependentiae bacterium]
MIIPAFTEGDTKKIEESLKINMDACIKHYERDLATIRTGRASTEMLDGVKVECYEQIMPIRDLATIAAPDARLLTIQPWDKGTLGAIEKAIQLSDLGLTPLNDGNLIRLQLPLMSSERRDELVKLLNKKAEEARVQIRNVRRDHMDAVKEAEKKKVISEDFSKRLSDIVQKITDQFIVTIAEHTSKKEAALRQV